MKVNDPNLPLSGPSGAAGAAGATHASETARTKAAENSAVARAANSSSTVSSDDVHLSELVRSLRALASESPERQAKIEQLARAHAAGSYRVDAEATASAIIDQSSGGGAAKRRA